jgi:hypothetical protein
MKRKNRGRIKVGNPRLKWLKMWRIIYENTNRRGGGKRRIIGKNEYLL